MLEIIFKLLIFQGLHRKDIQRLQIRVNGSNSNKDSHHNNNNSNNNNNNPDKVKTM